MVDYYELSNAIGQHVEQLSSDIIDIKAIKEREIDILENIKESKEEEINQLKARNKLKIIELISSGNLNNSNIDKLKNIERDL